MTAKKSALEIMNEILQDRLGERMGAYLFPPPVFVAMEGELLEIDLRERQRVYFQADVLDQEGNRLARAKATHWVAEQAW